MSAMACGEKPFMCLLSLLVLAHSDLQLLPEGRSSHKSCSGCEGPVMIIPAPFPDSGGVQILLHTSDLFCSPEGQHGAFTSTDISTVLSSKLP